MLFSRFSFLLLCSFALITSANAATLIESFDHAEGEQKLWIAGTKVRINMQGKSEYIVMDYGKRQFWIVNPAKREVIDASEILHNDYAEAGPLKINVRRIGKGPQIAGYATDKYQFSANGQMCDQVFVSSKAKNALDLDLLLDAISKVRMNPMGMQFMSDCDRAEGQFALRMKKIGMPLGYMEQNGKMTQEVRKIVANAKLPSGGFAVPSGYRKVSLQQMIQESQSPAGMPPMPPGLSGDQDLPPDVKQKMEQLMRQLGS